MTTRPSSPPELVTALLGNWTGVLEYRDYSQPATSTERVQLPTWLSVTQAPEGLRFHYVYDDGPGKTVDEAPIVAIDEAAKTYTVLTTEHPPQRFQISGLDALKQGRGVLVLNGEGTDNRKPADLRETITLRRNLLTILEETRPAHSAEPFAFRHRYVFTRAEAPPVPPTR